MILGHTIKDYKRKNLLHDVITGIIIMAVSIMDFSLLSPLEFFVDPKNVDGRNN